MPLYQYQCPTCGRTVEKIKNINDDSNEECECGSIAVKIISQSTFILKGGGWYASGYSKEKK